MKSRRRSRFWILAVLAAALGAASAFVGCDDPPSDTSDRVRLPDPDDAIDEPLMYALALAKNFHHEAQVYMADGKPDEAIAAVEKILQVRFPDGAAEGEDVRLDAYAKLGKLHLAQGNREEAMKWVQRGLDAATRDSFFRANLHTVRGEILHADADALAATGDTDDIKAKVTALRKEAIMAFEASNAIVVPLQERLYQQAKDRQP